MRIKDGSWRLLTRDDGKQGFEQVPGIAPVPSDVISYKDDNELFGN